MNVLTSHELVYIFSMLDIPSAGRAACVCTHWKNTLLIADTQEEIWENISNRFFGGDKHNNKWRLALKSFVQHYNSTDLWRRGLFAIKGGHVSLLMRLWNSDSDLAALKKANIDQLISRAAASKNPKVFKWLLSTGAIQSHPWSVLETAAEKGNLELVDMVFSASPEISSKMSYQGRFVFAAAIIAGKINVVEYLIDKGARLDIPTDRSYSNPLPAIHLAAKHCHLEILQLIQKKIPEKFVELANMDKDSAKASLCCVNKTGKHGQRLCKSKFVLCD
eukprot:Phypoly_transcript_04158.p1 GENE.Phypoly_transcript_04158~~Phypoly_transcript_04158.p1  ORF type:complete len:277 (+),score=40.01 Phypoly_transcript_04158:136-966(+)